MQALSHQMMGYDRAITMFSPDGRLLQVEYAKKTVRQGSTAVGMVCKDGVILVTDKRILDKLVVADNVEKISQIDKHAIATFAGISSDARILMERSQLQAQQHRVSYDSPIDILSLVKETANLKQICTQSGGLRPFGVSLLYAGIDVNGKMQLYETDPTGIYFPYKATVIGEGENEIREPLHKEYKDSLSMDDGLKLILKALKKFLGENFLVSRIDAAVVPSKTKLMEKVPQDKIVTSAK